MSGYWRGVTCALINTKLKRNRSPGPGVSATYEILMRASMAVERAPAQSGTVRGHVSPQANISPLRDVFTKIYIIIKGHRALHDAGQLNPPTEAFVAFVMFNPSPAVTVTAHEPVPDKSMIAHRFPASIAATNRLKVTTRL